MYIVAIVIDCGTYGIVFLVEVLLGCDRILSTKFDTQAGNRKETQLVGVNHFHNALSVIPE